MIERLSLVEGVVAGFTDRRDGQSQGKYARFNLSFDVGDEAENVEENRETLFSRLDANLRWSWLKQVHGTDVVNLPSAENLTADAAFTLQKGQVCSVMSADCLPVLLTDQKARFVAAVHCGWRSLASGILFNTLRDVQKALLVEGEDFDASSVVAYLGPCISNRVFEVGSEVRTAFLKLAPEKAESAFSLRSNGKYLADLLLLARIHLEQMRITNISDSGLCTFEDAGRFYSYRRDGQTGRMVSFIYIE
ncbi:MAG: peptidoglycan editing factor PgeF [Cellvibrionales bacterium]|nr:peptidoglycan editing factor PgeF [Cellvibrionales bacterium]